MEADWTVAYAEFDHYLYPAEFHQAVGMIVSALEMDICQARRWLRVRATADRQDLLVLAREVVARRLHISPNGLGRPVTLSAVRDKR